MEEAERNVKWILIISIIMFFVSTYGYLRFFLPYGVIPHDRDVWYHLANVNSLFFILTIISSALYGARFWKAQLTYKLSILFFVVSMTLLFIQSLRWLFS